MTKYYIYDKSDALHCIVEAHTAVARDIAMKAAIRLLGEHYRVLRDPDADEGMPIFEVRYTGRVEG